MKNESIYNLQDLWEHAIERATENKPVHNELTHDQLGEAAGVHIKSGVSASGLWDSSSCTCRPVSAIC